MFALRYNIMSRLPYMSEPTNSPSGSRIGMEVVFVIKEHTIAGTSVHPLNCIRT